MAVVVPINVYSVFASSRLVERFEVSIADRISQEGFQNQTIIGDDTILVAERVMWT